MSLGTQQREFTVKIASLIIWAYREGYQLTVGDFWAKDGHKDGSFHYKRLAADLNLFIEEEHENGKKVWVYQTTTEAHKPLGEECERMGGTWGGRFNDGNHYSLGE